jgi:hypothetical protein
VDWYCGGYNFFLCGRNARQLRLAHGGGGVDPS